MKEEGVEAIVERPEERKEEPRSNAHQFTALSPASRKWQESGVAECPEDDGRVVRESRCLPTAWSAEHNRMQG